MAGIFSAERIERNPGDLVLLASLFVLLGTGLAMLFSASFYWAQRLYQDPIYFVRRQVIWVGIGAVAGFIAARISLAFVKRIMPWLLLATLIAMVLTFVPGLGAKYLGARRWIFVFGSSFQPSEVVKVVLVLYLAHILDRKNEKLDDTVNSLLPPFIVSVVFAGLIYLQNDYSTSLFVLFVAGLMFFVARVKLRYFIAILTMVVPLATLLLLTREHRVARLIAFIAPEGDPAGIGYQVLASQRALSDGGLWGQGIGEGVRKLGSLPEVHSDFVFAVVGEELGLVGVFLVLALFLFFAYRGYRIAWKSNGLFNSLVAFGLTSTLLLQALLNMSVVAGLVPATGIPLPFFSAGGSSILMSMIACGLLMNVSRDTTGVRDTIGSRDAIGSRDTTGSRDPIGRTEPVGEEAGNG